MRRRLFANAGIAAGIYTSLFFMSPNVAAQSGVTKKLAGGLEATMISASRSCSGEKAGITIEISNPTKFPVDIIFVEEVAAQDNAGTAYILGGYSGSARCKHHYVADCLGHSGRGSRVPLEQFTRLDPSTSATAIFDLWHSSPQLGSLISVSAQFGYRVIDPAREETQTLAEKTRAVRTMNIGFPSYPLTIVGCK